MIKYENLQPCYFATPAVQLIMALQVSLEQILANHDKLELRFAKHREASNKVKSALESWYLLHTSTYIQILFLTPFQGP
jgi:alanine-glyoxylate transaminase / serine-glyoxylate transaminase / serine-pyruvate transaminase